MPKLRTLEEIADLRQVARNRMRRPTANSWSARLFMGCHEAWIEVCLSEAPSYEINRGAIRLNIPPHAIPETYQGVDWDLRLDTEHRRRLDRVIADNDID